MNTIMQNKSYMTFPGMKEKPLLYFDNQIKADEILQVVCDYFGFEVKAIVGKRRTKDICLCRFVAIWILRNNTKMSLKEIGEKLGGRDHTTVIHSVRALEGWMEGDFILKTKVHVIEKMIF